jgi:rubrerythrin
MIPDWSPFELAPHGAHADAPRSIHTPEGVGDRLRAAAFAEIQARDAFRWAAERFTSAEPRLREAWLRLADSEQRHLDWLLARMRELSVQIPGRKVSDYLWHSFMGCTEARQFAHYMADAEERGRRAGERFYQTLAQTDPTTAEIFRRIADEEIGHIALARRFFPDHQNT